VNSSFYRTQTPYTVPVSRS